MSFNLPASGILTPTKGSWENIQYPTLLTVQGILTPKDYFEPVPCTSSRSCIPLKSAASILFDGNSGKVTVHSEQPLPHLSLRMNVNNGAFEVTFYGEVMQVEHTVAGRAEVESVLYHADYVIPALLSLSSGLAIQCTKLELALNDTFEARRETAYPPHSIKVISEEARSKELQLGIEALAFALQSTRFRLATGYLREALFLSANYYEHNPYTQSLNVILKCSQTIEILFGSKRDHIRSGCCTLGIDDSVVESQIVPITLARNTLGSGHGSSFSPTADEVDTVRQFAHRSVHTVRQLMLMISKATPERRRSLRHSLQRDPEHDRLLAALTDSVKQPAWSFDGSVLGKDLTIVDPRLPVAEDKR